TTALVALLRGGELVLALTGDSRAYLVRDGRAEQLTVDGDVCCVQLAAGAPPEEVREMGPEASALYSCLGVCEPDTSGRFVPCLVRARPSITRWVLQPDDVLVLCTDGLVEEGVFLEPDDLPAVLAHRPGASAAELAAHLLRAAQDRQRGPSAWEPAGCG